MAKLSKFLAFATFASATCGVTYYFLNKNKNTNLDTDTNPDTADFFEKKVEREYVSLNDEGSENTADDTKEAIRQRLDEVATEIKEKAQAEADGVGVVKEEADTEVFEFEDFSTEEDENKED